MRLAPKLALATLALLLLCPLGARAAEEWEKDFQRDFAKPESWSKYAAVARLDASNGKARDMLLSVLDKQGWYLRTAAISALRSASGEALEDLKKDVKKHSSAAVREGIAFAFGQRGDDDATPALAEALQDKDERVRRAAAIALAKHGTKDAVGGIIAAWEKEKQADVKVWFRDSLEKISGKFLGPRVDDWKAWWKAVESDWVKPTKKEPPKPGEPADPSRPPAEKTDDEKKAEAEGKKTTEETTVLRDVELNFKEAGKGGPLFVLPEYGYGNVYLEKALLGLDDTARLFYIDLPGTAKFKNLPPGNTGLPEYPIDKLCDAFDELRKARKQERIGILGHGMAAWVGMRYATKYPKNVSHLILVSTWTSGKAWGDGRTRTEQLGKQTSDLDLEHWAAHCLFENGKPRYSPTSGDDQDAVLRGRWSSYFNDPRDAYAMLFWPQVERIQEMGGCQIPEFDVGKEKGNPVPTMLIYGTSQRAVWTSSQDMKQLNKYYPNSTVVECPNSNRMPMIEDYETFMKAVKGFFKKYPYRKGKSS
jgi:proline iminopeptidase